MVDIRARFTVVPDTPYPHICMEAIGIFLDLNTQPALSQALCKTSMHWEPQYGSCSGHDAAGLEWMAESAERSDPDSGDNSGGGAQASFIRAILQWGGGVWVGGLQPGGWV